MLKRLKVKNYALIEELDITFGKNLNIFTGQTGAGKSIIIGSINLIIGDKASLEMIRTGEEEGFVEAFFDLNIKQYNLKNFKGLNQSLIIKRVITKNGRSQAFLNGNQVPIGKLKEIGFLIIDILGQHHHQSLLNTNKHRELLDHFALKNLSIRIILFSFSFNLIMRLTFCVFEIIETISATFFGIDSKRSGQSFLL